MCELHPIDQVMQKQFPTVMVPLHSKLTPLDKAGHRFLMGKNGLWVEVKRPWLSATLKVNEQSAFPLPYGDVEASLSVMPIPLYLVKQFTEYAETQLPNECAAQIILDVDTGNLRLEILKAKSVGSGHVDFDLAPLQPNEHLVMDIHSHGYHPVYFSKKDDADDKGGFYIAGVIGFKKQEGQSSHSSNGIFRLCMNNLFTRLSVKKTSDHFHFYIGD